MFGEKIENPVDDPLHWPSLNSVKATYDLALMPEYEELMTTESSITGEKINRFTHIHQSPEDLIKKVKMQRLCGQKTAACFQRCVGMDAFNAIYSTTYEIDEIVERRSDGIVVRGAKAHQTGIINSHEVLVMPTIAMGEDDKDYAVSFSVPTNSGGIFSIVGRQSCDTRKLEGSQMDVGNAEFGGMEALVVFDNVFVPNDRIFLNG